MKFWEQERKAVSIYKIYLTSFFIYLKHLNPDSLLFIQCYSGIKLKEMRGRANTFFKGFQQ